MEYNNELHEEVCKMFGDDFTEESFRHSGFRMSDCGTYLSSNGNVRIQVHQSVLPLPMVIEEVAIKTDGEWTTYNGDDEKSQYFTTEEVTYRWPSNLLKYSTLQGDYDTAYCTILTEEGQKFVKDNIAREPEAEKVFLATTASGVDVYIEKETYDHMQAHPDVDLEVVKEAINKIDDLTADTPFRMASTDMDRYIGEDNCIQIQPSFHVQDLYRKNRDGKTPVVVDVWEDKTQHTTLVTTGICLDEGKHTMFTAFYGQLAPKEPWDSSLSPDAKAESEAFWSTHALAVAPDAIDWERSLADITITGVSIPSYRDYQQNRSFFEDTLACVTSDVADIWIKDEYDTHQVSFSKQIGESIVEHSGDATCVHDGRDCIAWGADEKLRVVPVLYYSDPAHNLKLGDVVGIGGCTWTVIQNNKMICNNDVGISEFIAGPFPEDIPQHLGTEEYYNRSDIKKWVEQWFETEFVPVASGVVSLKENQDFNCEIDEIMNDDFDYYNEDYEEDEDFEEEENPERDENLEDNEASTDDGPGSDDGEEWD